MRNINASDFEFEYETPFGIFSTWEEAASRLESCDLDPVEFIKILKVAK